MAPRSPAAAGFAAKQGVEVSALERLHTPKGEYLAFRRRQRGKAAVDVLPAVLGGTPRGLSFPKAMHRGCDARGWPRRSAVRTPGPLDRLPLRRPRRAVSRSDARLRRRRRRFRRQATGAVTYGHRFLTHERARRSRIKVRTFDEYRARLLENFVMLERSERHNKIARELDAKAQEARRGESAAWFTTRICCTRFRIWSSIRRSSPGIVCDRVPR